MLPYAQEAEPLHIHVAAGSAKMFADAAKLAQNLIDTLRVEHEKQFPYAAAAAQYPSTQQPEAQPQAQPQAQQPPSSAPYAGGPAPSQQQQQQQQHVPAAHPGYGYPPPGAYPPAAAAAPGACLIGGASWF